MMATDLREAAFLGRITAAFTHEVKNVLAIIKESAGLMEDLLALHPEPAFPHRERLVRCLATIQAQTKRGVELSRRLNRLAHSPDEEVARVDLNEILEQVIILSERFARLKGVSLLLHPYGGALSAVVSPVKLQMAVFACLECCWEATAAGGTVAVSVTLEGRDASVRFCCLNGGKAAAEQPVRFSDPETRRVIEEIVTGLPYRIAWCASKPGFELILPDASELQASMRGTQIEA